jgi:hypothetical protein
MQREVFELGFWVLLLGATLQVFEPVSLLGLAIIRALAA